MEERISVEKSAMAKAADARAAIARAAVSVTESSLFAAEIEAEAAEAEAVSRRAWETAQVFPVFQIIITFLCMHLQNFALLILNFKLKMQIFWTLPECTCIVSINA